MFLKKQKKHSTWVLLIGPQQCLACCPAGHFREAAGWVRAVLVATAGTLKERACRRLGNVNVISHCLPSVCFCAVNVSLLPFPTVFGVQNRPGSGCKEDWEVPQSTDAPHGGQRIPQRRHGNGLTVLKWRLFAMFLGSKYRLNLRQRWTENPYCN